MSIHYKSSLYELIARIHQKHFWFRARKHLIADMITRAMKKTKGKNFLEVGFGTGVVLHELDAMGLLTYGIDVNAKAIAWAHKQTRAKLSQCALAQYVPPKKIRFDGIGAFDVLEHQKNDQQFLLQCARLLSPGKFLFLTVPAGPWLWTQSDTEAGHHRRYTPDDLKSKLNRAGFDVVFINYWNFSTVPFYICWKVVASVFKKKEAKSLDGFLKLPNPVLSAIFESILAIEKKFIFSVWFPWGSSLVVTAVKI